MMKNLLYTFLICLIGTLAFSQGKEANTWYFGEKAGVDFNSGDPVPLLNGVSTSQNGATSCISDSSGAIMFYTNGDTIWNRDHAIMPNGIGIGGDCMGSALIVPLPGNTHVYYVFTVGGRFAPKGLCYSIVDMNLNSGYGQVVLKNVPVDGVGDANIFLTAAKHANNEDWWIIVRRLNNNKYATFLLTTIGLNTTPILSSTRYMDLQFNNNGQMKVSPDRTLLVTSFFRIASVEDVGTEVSKFNAATGRIDYKYVLSIYHSHNTGIEFSPDSKFLYIVYKSINWADSNGVIQYEISDIDSLPIISSAVSVGSYPIDSPYGGIQLGADGRIYLMSEESDFHHYLSVIQDPWKKGVEANLQTNSYWLGGRSWREHLPNLLQDFLFRFDWSGGPCAGVPFNFRHRFLPEPDSIHWDFGDPGSGFSNHSTIHNPTHTFSAGGTYEVYAYVHYPNGRIEETSRKVEVLAKPYPNLGPDTLVCIGTSVSLTPGSGFTGYFWNGAITPGSPTYLATDTGTFVVRVKNELGCYNADTIKVLQRPAPALDETNLNIAPTTCGKTNGAITGLQLIGEPPFTFQWTASGTPVSDSLDIYHLGTGFYELHVIDGFGCTNIVASYAISDAGNIWIDTATVSPAYCGNTDGTLTITAISGLGSMLQYFIKTGNDTLTKWGDGNFAGLAGGTYYVWVSDSGGCSRPYAHVLQIDALTAPEIVTATSTPETGSAADGTITVNASGNGLTYSLNGATPANTGHFTGLSAGSYSVTVTNTAGCDTTFTVTVAYETGIVLSAIAGNGFACLGKEAKAPIVVRNFKDVQSFETILNFDKLFVNCIGYSNPNPQLGDSLEVTLFPASGKIQTRWKGTMSLTLPDSAEIVQLVFSSLLPGNALLLWDISPAISNFFGPVGDTLNVDYTLGTILVSNPPQILPAPEQKVCEGELLGVSANVQNGTGPLSYQWQTPTGPSSQEIIFKTTATLADNGLYSLIVTDTRQCADTSSQIVTVVPTPVSGFPAEGDTLYFDERIHLEANQGYDQYTWSTGDTTSSILVTAEGWYKVVITTGEGCTATDSVMMLYAFAPFTMPNAFKPDGDNINDVFRPVTLPEKISSFSMYIYDRWGMQVFFTNDITRGWDGTIKGNPAQIGGYVYVIRYRNSLGAERERRGLLTLVR